MIKTHVSQKEKRIAQEVLAKEVVQIVHGKEGLETAMLTTKMLFGKSCADVSHKYKIVIRI